MARKAKDKSKKKRSFGARIRARLQEIAELGRTLESEPKAFPGELWMLLKRSLRSIWHARGGGLYATGYLLTFVWLEINTLAEELLASESALAFVTGQLVETLFRVVSESLLNSILAFGWPLFVLEWSPVWGGVLLGALYLTFDRFLKAPLTNWLFREDEQHGAGGDSRP